MQITIRSLGSKLIIAAMLTFLLCIFLFIMLSWGALQFYTGYQAKRDAQTHLSLIKQAGVQGPQFLLILIGIGLFIFALGIIIYTFVISVLFIRPLRRLQVHAQSVVASSTGIQLDLPRTNELNMLASSLSVLSDSLHNESQALTEQMSNLLVMSDSLMSTLNLEQLLGEFVSRMGRIMNVNHA